MAPDTPPTPWERARAGQRARRSETQGAKLQGGQRQPASGALRGRPGDIRDEDWLIEDKYTDADSFTITTKLIDKIMQEALQSHGRLAMLRITLPRYKLRVMREDDYLYLKARAEAAKD
jgi:hypothetical protein